jgi:hypothetical protein
MKKLIALITLISLGSLQAYQITLVNTSQKTVKGKIFGHNLKQSFNLKPGKSFVSQNIGKKIAPKIDLGRGLSKIYKIKSGQKDDITLIVDQKGNIKRPSA